MSCNEQGMGQSCDTVTADKYEQALYVHTQSTFFEALMGAQFWRLSGRDNVMIVPYQWKNLDQALVTLCLFLIPYRHETRGILYSY